MFCEKGVLQLYQKEIQAQVLSNQIYEIFKNAYFEEHMGTTAFVSWERLHIHEALIIK